MTVRAVDPARRVAFDALRRVDADDAYLNLTLPALLTQREMTTRDAAFATELAYGTSRHRASYDAVLERCVRGGVETLEPPLHVALLLGLHQLLGMRVAAHAAVSTTVDLVRSDVGERPVRLTNAVLRAASARDLNHWMDELAPAYATDPVGHLAMVCSHPRWIVEAYRDVLDDVDRVRELLVANNTPAPVTLALRPGLAARSELAGLPGQPGRWSPYAWRLATGSPATIPLVRAGKVGVQDEGSQLAALALATLAGSGRWLDLCAGPGGKAALLAGLAAGKADLVAAERLPHRARLVADALGAYSARPSVVVADGTRRPWRDASFDAVLADVPCTGLGALRRRPEARWRRRPSDLDSLVPLQRRLLSSALDSTRSGGVVAYVTCSPHRAETTGVVESVLAGRDDVEVADAPQALVRAIDARADEFSPGQLGAAQSGAGQSAGGQSAGEQLQASPFGAGPSGRGPYIQLWPHVHDTDAMFVALLIRR